MYINASHVELNGKEYIVTQCPQGHTMIPFWTMVWEMNAEILVMLNHSTEHKCSRYWPMKFMHLPTISIECRDEKILDAWIVRQFTICSNGKCRSILHYQFTEWPDHDLPRNPFMFLQFVSLLQSITQPMIVHCAAGCGRSGIFVLFHACWKKLSNLMSDD